MDPSALRSHSRACPSSTIVQPDDLPILNSYRIGRGRLTCERPGQRYSAARTSPPQRWRIQTTKTHPLCGLTSLAPLSPADDGCSESRAVFRQAAAGRAAGSWGAAGSPRPGSRPVGGMSWWFQRCSGDWSATWHNSQRGSAWLDAVRLRRVASESRGRGVEESRGRGVEQSRVT
jgi:hypothetical protein